MNLIFVVVVVMSFGSWMAASFIAPAPWPERAARSGFFIASLLWALTNFHG